MRHRVPRALGPVLWILACLFIRPGGDAAAAGDAASGNAAGANAAAGSASAVAGAAAADSGAGVVWLAVETSSSSERVRLLAPLEWLALIDDEGELNKRATMEGIEIDASELWRTYRDLPKGTQRELQRGVTTEGDPYIMGVRCDSMTGKAEGKLHILTRDEEGKVTDVRFPLDLPALFTHLLSSFQFRVKEEGKQEEHVRIPGRDELMRLGSYGTFTLIEVWKPDEQVKIAIE